MLPGIEIKPLRRFPDERGSFTEVMRKDWSGIFGEEVVQANLSITYPGIVRAWHKHERGQIDYFLVVNGSLKICAYDDETKELSQIISTGENPQTVKIPGHYWHGIKAVGNEKAILVYFVNRLYDYSNPDELRRPWNDPTIVPETLNGKAGDPKCGVSWDWLWPAHC